MDKQPSNIETPPGQNSPPTDNSSRTLLTVFTELKVLDIRKYQQGIKDTDRRRHGLAAALLYAKNLIIENPSITLEQALLHLSKELLIPPNERSSGIDSEILTKAQTELVKRREVLDLRDDDQHFIIQAQTEIKVLLEKKRKEKAELYANETQKIQKEIKKEQENQLIKKILSIGEFNAFFSAVIVDSKGDTRHAGFKSYCSQNTELQLNPGVNNITSFASKLYKDERNFLRKLSKPVFDSVIMKPLYRRNTKQIKYIEEKKVEKGYGPFKRTITVPEQRIDAEFIGNSAEFMTLSNGEKNEAVELHYQTLVHLQSEIESLYTDEHERPGNLLLLKLKIPRNNAQLIKEYTEEDPSFIRRLVSTLLMDEKKGIQSTISKGDYFESDKYKFGDFPNLPFYDHGLPPYDKWGSTRMYIDLNLDIPKHDVKEDHIDQEQKSIAELAQEFENKCVEIL